MRRLLIVSCIAGCILTGNPVAGDPATPAPEPKVAWGGLVDDLGAVAFRTRRDAQERLLTLGKQSPERVLAVCVAYYATREDVEVRARLEQIMQQLVDEHLFRRPRGFLGIHIQRTEVVDDQDRAIPGVAVMQLTEGSAAAAAGMLPADLITQIGKLTIGNATTIEDFVKYIQSRPAGETLDVKVLREGKPLALAVKLGVLPEEMTAPLLTEGSGKAFYKNWLEARLKQFRAAQQPTAAPDEP